MTGKTHIAAGALSSFLLLIFTSKIHLAFLLFGMLGGIMPDLDASESTIKHLGFHVTKRFKIKPFLIPAMLISFFCEHRGVIHSLLGLLIFSIIFTGSTFWWLDSTFLFCSLAAFTLGYLSHLLTDACTKSGVPLFYPISKKSIYVLPEKSRIYTGSLAESSFEIVFLIVFFLCFIGFFLKGKIYF